MKCRYFFVLTVLMILGTYVSCKKENFDYRPTTCDTCKITIPKSNLLEYNCSNWVNEGSGKFSDKLEGILDRLKTPEPNSGGIRIYVIEHNQQLPINSTFKYRLGVIWAEISKTDVTIYYQSDDRTSYLPFTEVNIKIVSQ